ncbi:MAG: hypothetical protein ABUT39_22320 [Acidobacteriota bacterium]
MRKTAFLLLTLGLAFASLAQAENLQIPQPERRVLSGSLSGDIVEYTFQVPVGSGPHDVIGVHRVVKETAPGVPARSSKGILLAHGDIWGFRAAFLADPAHSLPVFLASHGVDVWGIDFRWTLVPASTTDFTFLKNWGVKTDAHDLGVALTIARGVRLATGSGFGKLLLLGWSRGGQISYAYLDAESQIPPGLRQVRGFIPVDIYLKTDVEALRLAACTRYQGTLPGWQAGTFQSINGVLVKTIHDLAVADPNGASPILPGFTNRQASLAVGSMTFLFFPPGLGPVPNYHFTGGTLDANGLPNGLNYTSESRLLALEAGSSPYQPIRELLDADAATCDDPAIAEVSFDDHLDDIKVPILYIGADGGFGHTGIYTTTLLGSTDVSSVVVDLQPASAPLAEFGHADIFLATNAQTFVWQPMLTWIQGH